MVPDDMLAENTCYWFYLYARACNQQKNARRQEEFKKNFILGYMLYKLLVWTLAIVIAYVLYKAGLSFIDGMLQYIS